MLEGCGTVQLRIVVPPALPPACSAQGRVIAALQGLLQALVGEVTCGGKLLRPCSGHVRQKQTSNETEMFYWFIPHVPHVLSDVR
jgi:hypothetical protein